MTGGELQDLITRAADELGLWWVHFPDSRRVRGRPGWVDLVVLSYRGRLFGEVKGSGDKRTIAQVQVGLMLGPEYRLWDPRGWHDGTVRKDLEKLAGLTRYPPSPEIDNGGEFGERPV